MKDNIYNAFATASLFLAATAAARGQSACFYAATNLNLVGQNFTNP